MSNRPTKDEYFLTIAYAVRARSTCVRRPVGCVLVNGLGHMVGSGYNGRPAGYEHCNHQLEVRHPADIVVHENAPDFYVTAEYPHACKDAFAPKGSKPAGCEAIHAEVNATLQCYDVLWIDTCYITRSPCVPCTKMLLNTACRRIVFSEPSSDHDIARELWTRNNSPEAQARLSSLTRKVRVWDQVEHKPCTI